jgi:iron complex transport system ATP-binding protein
MIINRVSGGYPGEFVMTDISFTMEEGKIYALLGLNGAGKTTIIKTICGLIKATSGNVMIDDKDILTLKEKERAQLISYVPQRSNLVYYTTVIDVVLMGVTPYLKTFQSPSQEHTNQARKSLEKLGIEELAETNYLNLSEGQKQLVLIARALIQNGKYMLLDEPESSLDLVNKHRLMHKLREIIIDYNKSSLISMHDPEYALNYCDKILLLKNKQITEVDLKTEGIDLIEEKLIEIYGPIKILKHDNQYILYYNG